LAGSGQVRVAAANHGRRWVPSVAAAVTADLTITDPGCGDGRRVDILRQCATASDDGWVLGDEPNILTASTPC